MYLLKAFAVIAKIIIATEDVGVVVKRTIWMWNLPLEFEYEFKFLFLFECRTFWVIQVEERCYNVRIKIIQTDSNRMHHNNRKKLSWEKYATVSFSPLCCDRNKDFLLMLLVVERFLGGSTTFDQILHYFLFWHGVLGCANYGEHVWVQIEDRVKYNFHSKLPFHSVFVGYRYNF